MNKSTIDQSERLHEYDLMQRVAAGNDDAFNVFYTKYNKLIYSTVAKVLNNPDDVEEVCNDVLTTMWKKADGYHPEKGSLVTWICTTARNRAIDRIRSHQRRAALYNRYEEKIDVDTPAGSDAVTEHMDRQDARQILRSAIVNLTPEQKEVVELAYFQGLTQVEIANQIDRPLGTVKARIRRGVDQIRKTVNHDFKGERDSILFGQH